jgi:hypothetical protein
MINLTMWVLHRNGEVRQDSEGCLVFDTREQAMDYWQECVPIGDNGWKPKKVRVTDAK